MADWVFGAAGWAVEKRRPRILRTRLPKEERARIVEECCRPGASLAVVARRHRLAPSALRNWIRVEGRTEDVETRDVAPLPEFVPLVLEEPDRPRDGDGGRPWGCRACGCGRPGHANRGADGVLRVLAEIDPDASLRIVLATRRVSFNKGLDGLAGIVENRLALDPYSGVVVVFRCHSRPDQIKVLWWDGTSLVLAHKRLERGRFLWPPMHHGAVHLPRAQFELLFAGLDWRGMLDPRVVRASRAR